MNHPNILLALDFDNAEQAYQLAQQLNPALCRLKIGKALFTRAGTEVVTRLQDQGFQIFLDLKYHDIPNTVADAVRAAADLGVWMVNVHASGGRKMLHAAVRALENYQQRPLLIAVTVLTSLSEKELSDVGIATSLEIQVTTLTSLAYEAGFDGVVCSAREAKNVKMQTDTRFIAVTPGIRPADNNLGASVVTTESLKDDQMRVMTPEQAIIAGSDYLVIGRPITASADPLAKLEAISQSIQSIIGLSSHG